MYSVVLLMALSNGAEAPAAHHRRGGCDGGCTGYVETSCTGGYGCAGSCSGGGHHRGHKHRGHGHSCNGGCTGYAAAPVYSCSGGYGCEGSSCHGGGHKLFGGHKHRGGHGCCGGGSCYGSAYAGCTGGYAGCTGGVPYGAMPYGGTMVPPPAQIGVPPTTVPPAREMPKNPEKKPSEVRGAAPATISVSLPAAAKLTIDDAATVATGSSRTFVSPVLEAGMEFHYDLKAELSQNGKTVTAAKRVTVRAGEAVQVAIEMPTAEVASK
jgi:uncharacterized protein (TIGR03000 family)